MDKLRKLGLILWQNKERMVLVILVAVLAYRVYKVMTETFEPPELSEGATVAATDSEAAGSNPIPTDEGSSENYRTLSERNPFWYYGARTEGTATEGINEEDDIALLDIQRSPGGQYAAQIQTTGTKWYQEGEPFESYQLLKIDPENRSVEVYSGKSGTTLTLTM
ncbi:MAG: hypothetical protein RBU21_05455 [FCB group bacterium]|jgi:hypothetical protein|nr:hypothetical protein [FCB group bacterium]